MLHVQNADDEFRTVLDIFNGNGSDGLKVYQNGRFWLYQAVGKVG